METKTLPGSIDFMKEAWAFYKPHWKLLSGMILVPYAVMAIGGSTMQYIAVGSVVSPSEVPFLFVGFFLFLAGVIALLVANIGVVASVGAIDSGSGPVKFWHGYRSGLKLFWPFVWVMILGALSAFGSMALLAFPYAVFAVYASLTVFAFVIGGKRGVSAFAESYSLVKGRWWSMLGRLIVGAIALFVLPSFVVTGAGFIAQIAFGHSAAVSLATMGVVRAVVNAFAYPIWLVYLYRIYMSLTALRAGSEPVSVVGFKRWTIAFAVVGIMVPVIFVVIARAANL